MHLGNGIICPITGIPMLAAMGITAIYAFKKSTESFTKEKITKTAIITALVFALQMLNFAIPQTGSSGHIIGGILLAALLGPYVAFLAMCLILSVQALFFADGGLLALGCNIFNMGFIACFVAYPLLFKPFEKKGKPFLGAILASVAALQLGSVSVVTETALCATVTNPLDFASFMQPIHLPIGLIEGLITGAVIIISQKMSLKNFSLIFGAVSLMFAGIISQYASTKPDGLEWSLLKISDSIFMQTQGFLFNLSNMISAKTAFLANAPSSLANISGLIIIFGLMYICCTFICRKSLNNAG